MSTPFWGPDFDQLSADDPEIAGVVLDELERLRGGLQLIASENFTSPAVLAAMGSTLSNKYAEGYPGRRYYGGCQVVDRAEEIGIARAKELFGAEHANLQPHSGASANFAVYAALPQSVLFAPRVVIPVVEAVLLVALIATNPRRMTRETRWSRIASALLAGLVQSPDSYNPISRNPKAAMDRRTYVLGSMKTMGVITAAQAKAATAKKIGLHPRGLPTSGCTGVPAACA